MSTIATPTVCASCEARTTARGYTLCTTCTRTLTTALANVVAHHADLQSTVRTRRTRFGGGGGPRSDTHPLPLDVRFTPSRPEDDPTAPLTAGKGDRVDLDVRTTLNRWSKTLLTTWPPIPDQEHQSAADALEAARRAAPTRHSVAHHAAHIRRLVDHIARHDHAPRLLDDMLRLERTLRAVIDRPGDRWPLGTCGLNIEPEKPHNITTCGCRCHHGPRFACDTGDDGCHPEQTVIPAIRCEQKLWAPERDSRIVTCPGCGTQWPVAYRREVLLDVAEDEAATVEQIARIVTAIEDRDGQTARLASRIRRWTSRGELTAVGSTLIAGRQRSLYRVRDVRDLLARNDHRSPITGVSRTA
ncbi:hypothetical protein [Nocardioides alkalitolerans]|uniref:hypothetical protein n=1 Tax=Nocardioides alkalitolerans TaxID=281714 RepID=UPI00040B29EC|nr:hypothetical protein [Nocardioides alkalitolerans]